MSVAPRAAEPAACPFGHGANGPSPAPELARSLGPAARFAPPRPKPLPALPSLLRVLRQGDGDLLSLLPDTAYQVDIGTLGYSRRSIWIVNAPALVRQVLLDPDGVFPKSDLMVMALEPLVGDSIFVSGGDLWARHRAMIDPAFTQLRVDRGFRAMAEATEACEARLDQLAHDGAAFDLDLAMTELTADVICRTVFSTPLESRIARDVFDAFLVFERSVAQVKVWRLIVDPPWTRAPQDPAVVAACATIRARLGDLVDRHLAAAPGDFDDIAAEVIAARDAGSGQPFDRDQLIDELGVLFLAGHETTASGLTWAFTLLALQPELVARARAEIDRVCGAGPVTLEHVRALPLVRAIFKETLRLYPPITFLPRIAARDATIGRTRVRAGALIMIAPWVIHRHQKLWADPDAFDPDRFLDGREREIVPGAYLPFGLGPRVCAGATFAQTEATLILARLLRRFDIEVMEPEALRPVARLTTRPAKPVEARVRWRA